MKVPGYPDHTWKPTDADCAPAGFQGYQCSECKRFTCLPPDWDETSLDGQCGVPGLQEHWKVNGINGIVEGLHGDTSENPWSFLLVHRLNGFKGSPSSGESWHPFGTPDETLPDDPGEYGARLGESAP